MLIYLCFTFLFFFSSFMFLVKKINEGDIIIKVRGLSTPSVTCGHTYQTNPIFTYGCHMQGMLGLNQECFNCFLSI